MYNKWISNKNKTKNNAKQCYHDKQVEVSAAWRASHQATQRSTDWLSGCCWFLMCILSRSMCVRSGENKLAAFWLLSASFDSFMLWMVASTIFVYTYVCVFRALLLPVPYAVLFCITPFRRSLDCTNSLALVSQRLSALTIYWIDKQTTDTHTPIYRCLNVFVCIMWLKHAQKVSMIKTFEFAVLLFSLFDNIFAALFLCAGLLDSSVFGSLYPSAFILWQHVAVIKAHC